MPTASPFEHSVAVVIGIDRYRNGVRTLRTAANDARRLGELLKSEHGYDVISLLDDDATQARITTLLKVDLPARIGPADRVLFYFAGHGVARDGDEGPNGYLLPVDASRSDDSTFLHMPLVHDALLALPCRHMLVILDSCFSGAFRWSSTRDVDEEPAVVHREKYERYVRDPAWQVITSAAQDEEANDLLSAGALGTRPGEGPHSPFALALFDALRGAGDLVPAGGDGLLTATELYTYLDDTLQSAVQAAGREQQTPRLFPLKKHDRGEFLFFIPGKELQLPPAPPLTFESNPWRGLTSYEAGDASLFFGRDAEITALASTVEAQPLTVVLGASGSGKSSLVKAGVVPALVKAGWQAVPIIRPGTAPIGALAKALAPPGRSIPDATPDTVAALVAARLKANPGTKLLLVIDQFEELITLVRRGGDRERTIALLARLLEAHPDAVRVVITLRTDFEPNFDRGALADAWQHGRYVVPLMSRAALRDVIEKPATARVLYFEPSSLVDTLLDEVVATPGPLPLLSFALSEMYIRYVKRQGGDRAITREDYDALGGVVGALRARAEAEHDALDETGRGTLRRVMLRLVSPEGAGVARRRATDAELDFADDAEQQRAHAIVQRLVEGRLLVRGKDPAGVSFVEPAHDALVRGWGQLAEWVRDEGDAIFPLAQQQRLARAAQEWSAEQAPKRKHGLLWGDPSRSAQLAPLVRRRAVWLNKTELAFAQRSVRRRRAALAGLAAAVALIVLGGIAALIAGRRASARAEQVRIASVVRSATSMVQEDPLLAAQLLGSIDSAMIRSADDATQLAMLGAALDLRAVPNVIRTFETGTEITDAVVSPDGHWVATAATDSIVRVWPVNGASAPITLPKDAEGVRTVVFSPDGRRIAAGDGGGTVTLHATQGRGVPVTLRGPGRPVSHIEYSSDSTRMLVTYDGDQARVFAADGSTAPVLVGRPGDIVEMARWADGGKHVVLIDGDRNVEFWTVGATATLGQTVRLAQDPVDVIEVARAGWLTPQGRKGRLLALGTRGGRMQLRDASTGRLVRELKGHDGAVLSLSFGFEDRMLVSASSDNEVRVLRVSNSQELASLRGSADLVEATAFSSDGRWMLLAGSTTFEARAWTGVPGDPPLVMPGHLNQLVTAAFVPGDYRVLTASVDGRVRLWELPSPPLYFPVGYEVDSAADVMAAGFSRDGRELALALRQGTISAARIDTVPEVWREVGTVPLVPCALSWAPADAALDVLACDGRTVALPRAGQSTPQVMGSDTGVVQQSEAALRARRGLWVADSDAVHVWDATTPSRSRVVRAPGVHAGRCAAITDDGAQLAVCAGDVVELRPFTGTGVTRRLTLSGHPTAVAFDHAGTTLAIGQENGRTRLVRLDQADTGRVLDGQRRPVTRLSFASDDKRVLSASEDGSVLAWEVANGRQLVRLQPRGMAVKSARFTQDDRRIITLGFNQHEARVWNADGAGGSVRLPGDGTVVLEAVPSPDGRWVLVTTEGQSAWLYPTGLEVALAPLRASHTCLPAAGRVRYLAESARVAEQRAAECAARR